MLKKELGYEVRKILFGKDRGIKKEVITGYATSFDGTQIWFRKVSPVKKIDDKTPPLVLSNGIGTTIRYWRYVEDYISDITDVVVWDYRGHGRSGAPKSEDVSMNALAKDMKAVCDELEIKEGIFGGFSMGVLFFEPTDRSHPLLFQHDKEYSQNDFLLFCFHLLFYFSLLLLFYPSFLWKGLVFTLFSSYHYNLFLLLTYLLIYLLN